MRFATDIARAKMGVRFAPGTLQEASNLALPAIPDTHSILIEEFSKHNSWYRPGAIGYISLFSNAAINEFHSLRTNWAAAYTRIGYLTLSTVGGGGAIEDSWKAATERLQYYAYLLDKTSFLKTVYYNGDKIISPVMAANNRPTYNTINNRIYLFFPGSFIAWDCEVALFRLTTLNGIPADIDAAIKRMYVSPMTLDASLAAVGVEMHQWDFQDIGYSTAAFTTIADHGLTPTAPLTSSVDIRPLLVECEKP